MHISSYQSTGVSFVENISAIKMKKKKEKKYIHVMCDIYVVGKINNADNSNICN